MGYTKNNPCDLTPEQAKWESHKISMFLVKAAPLIMTLLEMTFRHYGIGFTRGGKGLSMKYDLKKGKLSSKMFLNNLFLEVATVDRDSNPLRYDHRLNSFQFFMNRVKDVINSKLAVLLPLMDGKSPEEAGKIAKKLHPDYERFVMKMVDQDLSEEMKKKIKDGFMPE